MDVRTVALEKHGLSLMTLALKNILWALAVWTAGLLGFSETAWAESVYAVPATCVDNGSTGTRTWSNWGRGTAYDGSYATVSVDGTISHYLKCTGYGFAIPAGATINGIVVTPVRFSSGTPGSLDAAVRLVNADTTIGTTDRSTATTYPTTSTEEIHGGAADLWGTSWGPSDINDADFGVAFSVTKPSSSGAAQTVSVDTLVVTVYYTPAVAACNPPANIPGGVTVTCQCDNFGRASLNPSPIFGGTTWGRLSSDGLNNDPYINQTWGNLRLTENTASNAKDVTVPSIFPAAGNYISVEFRQFAYHGTGADGIAVTLSDYSQVASPGQYGGSLGYAQRDDCTTLPNCPGFNGGWVGIALDEYGNYQNPTEGRLGGTGSKPETVGVRGSGQAQAGYQWLQGNAAAISPAIDNPTSLMPSRGYSYQVIVDARNAGNATPQTFVAVNRDTTGGTNYASSVINSFDVFARATFLGFTQAAVPANWKISFTGSTGGSTNIHEIGALRVCAQTMAPPSAGNAAGFNAVDSWYTIIPPTRDGIASTGDIFTKLANTPFALKVAALNANGTGVLTTYAAGGNKTVTLQLIDDSSGASCNASAAACSGCAKPAISFQNVVGGALMPSQTMTFTPGDAGGPKTTPNFVVANAYSKLLVRMTDGSTTGCSTDWFSVRPQYLTSFTTTAGNAATSGPPTLKAGSGSFTLTATASNGTATTSNYSGTPSLSIDVLGTGLIAGTLTPPVFGAASSGVATQVFNYSEVGYFYLDGYNPDFDTATTRGIYDNAWTVVDNSSGKIDCVVGSYSNALSVTNGKYGCLFGLTSPNGNATPTRNGVGRFIPDHFTLVSAQTKQRSDVAAAYAAAGWTTGTIGAASTALTVISPAMVGFSAVAGDTVVIFGAGGAAASGKDLVTTITSVVGSVLNLAAPAATAVTATPVFKRLGFTYMEEPLQLSFGLEARNGSDAKTINYTTVSGLAKLDNASPIGTGIDSWGVLGVVNNLNGLANCRAVFSGTAPFNTSYNGAGCPVVTPYVAAAARIVTSSTAAVTWAAGAASLTTNVTLKRASVPDGAFDFTNGTFALGIWPTDSDGVTLAAATKNLDTDATAGSDRVAAGVADMRFGRLQLFNTWGSDLTNLTIPLQAQYWNGQTWAQNTLDNATVIPVASVALSGQTGALNSSNMGAANVSSAGTLTNGSGSIVLRCPYWSTLGPCPRATKPSPTLAGGVDLAINLGGTTTDSSCAGGTRPATTGAGLAWLKSQNGSCSTTFDQDPWGRMSFGIASPETNRSVHIRELF